MTRFSAERIFLFLMTGLLLLAFWLRVEWLDTYPPGLSEDEAVNVIDAHDIGSTGRFPLYQDTGRPEPLYRIVLAFGVRFLGSGVWSLRLMTAFLGTLTIAAAYWAARECLYDLPSALRAIAGMIAAASLAVALSHVVLSRALYRAILEPLLMFLFVGFLMRGLHTGRRRHFVLSGIAWGLALYSYTAALLLPAALPVVALSLLIFRFKTWRTWLPNLVALGIAFAIVIAPLGWLFLTESDRVLARSSQVKGELSEPGQRARRVWDQFFHTGDINPQYNAAQAPLLPPVFDLVFKLGLAALLIRVRHPSSALIAALLILGAIPVFASNEIPHGLRIMGEFAAFPLVIGAGAAVMLALLARLPRPTLRTAAYGATVAVTLAITAGDAQSARQDYHDSWAHPTIWRVFGRELTHGEWFFRTDQREWARWLAEQPNPLLVPMDDLNRPVTRAWLITAYPHVRAAGDDFQIPVHTRLALPWALELNDLYRDTRFYALLDSGTITLLPPLSAGTHAVMLEGIDEAQAIRRANGDLLARVKPIPADLPVTYEPRSPATVSGDPLLIFDDRVQIIGWRGPDTLPGGEAETVTYTLDWAARRSINHYYTVFLQLQTQDTQKLAGDDVPIWRWLFPPTLWQRGDVIPNPHTLIIPADLPPGAYRLAVGAYLTEFTNKLRLISAPDGVPLGTMATLGWVKVPQPAMPAPDQGKMKPDAILGDAFALRGASAQRLEGGQVRVTLYWESLVERPAVDATIFVHLLGPAGALVDQDDARPWGGQYPTFIWGQGERVQTEYLLDIGEAAAGDLRVIVGMYTFPDLTRLPVTQDGTPVPDGVVDLGSLEGLIEGH